MAINKFKTSMAALTNELTVAAANINIDFTLIKCEAPKEYQGLGNDLSKKHKSDAETGTIHATAQRLGNLFQGVCPPTPKLVKAYGTRISEISNAAKCETSPRNVNPIFADYSGVDGASIWAAATSSATALQVQMLACMLAYHWKAPDATAIWVEIVKERKRQIASIFEGDQSLPFSTLTAAAQQDMPRSELADWDASARAWIRVAERIKSREQKKLTLILNNIGIPVNKDEVVYSSVLAAWTTALKTMESLLSGMPQATQSGAIPLALYAWHLYPDIVVPSANAELRIQDSLIPPGGVLTLGLAHAGAESRSGVSWSLSLAHLRYYGHPVRREQPLSQAVTRATFREFTQAVFGSLLGCWQITGSETKLSAEFFAGIQTALEQDTTGLAPLYRRDSSRWLHLMMDAARALLDEPGAKVPFELGQRRWRNFIGKPELHSFFGLSTPGILLVSLDGPAMLILRLRGQFLANHINGRGTSTIWRKTGRRPSPIIDGSLRKIAYTFLKKSALKVQSENILWNLLLSGLHCSVKTKSKKVFWDGLSSGLKSPFSMTRHIMSSSEIREPLHCSLRPNSRSLFVRHRWKFKI
jgi:hypothetical protein